MRNRGGGAAFFYDANGRQYVEVSKNELLVKLKPGGGGRAAARPAFMGQVVRPPNLPEHAARLEDRLARSGFHVYRGAQPAQTLAAQADVEWALPLLHSRRSRTPIYMTDEIVLKFGEGVSGEAVRNVLDAYGCTIVRRDKRVSGRYICRVNTPSGIKTLKVANELHEREDVDYAHPEFYIPKIALAPPTINDPLYSTNQWHLDGDASKGATAGADINAEVAWDTANAPNNEGDPNIRVSIIDECVEKNHPDLAPNYVTGRDFDPPGSPGYDDDPSPDDPHSQMHGTSCAGVAVGAANSIGVRGSAPRCGLIGVKFFGASLSEDADAFLFSMDPNGDNYHSDGAAVMSNSWGYDGTFAPTDVVNAIHTVVTTGRDGKGCVVLFAAANNDHTVDGISAMAQLEDVICVGGTNSNRYHVEYSDSGPEVSVTAPTSDGGGDGIRSSAIRITTTDTTGGGGHPSARRPPPSAGRWRGATRCCWGWTICSGRTRPRSPCCSTWAGASPTGTSW